jgi:LAS superfamily LD-carboxypeptidase LdcB
MVAAARREKAEIAADPRLLTVFSGFRDPAADAARCSAQQNCQGLVRAECSAHRTGLAVDLYLGAEPGFAADSSDSANRLYQTKTTAYRWLVANAGRFGFVNYVYEPWHWEWTGAQP